MQSQRQWWFLFAFSLASLGCLASLNSVTAQITPDRTLGSESSRVTPDTIKGVPSDRLDGGARRGANLFHSFRNFNVGEGRGAYFTNPAGIENILSRVTGGNASQILGTLGVLGDANLFLINPNGLIFGPNARLDVGGAFVGTTASGVRLGESGQFSASAPQTSQLLAIQPSALFFNAPAAGGITNRSQFSLGETNSGGAPVGLQVPDGQTLALVGGKVVLEGGNLTAAAGRIELGSVAGTGDVSLNQSGQSWRLEYDAIQAFGDIQLQNEAFVDVSGSGGGDVQVQGARLEMSGSFVRADTLGSESGGEVLVRTTEAVTLSNESRLIASVENSGTGGNLKIETGRLSVRDGAQIGTGTFSSGDGGSLTVKATESVLVVGTTKDGRNPSTLSTQTIEGGAAGDLSLVTRQLIVQDGAQIGTGNIFGSGDGGSLTVKATESVELIGTTEDGQFPSGLFTQTQGKGAAGALSIETGQLIVRGGAQVSAGTRGSGDGGSLTINASESVELIGASADGQLSSGLFTASKSISVIDTTADGQFPSGLFSSIQEGGAAGSIALTTPRTTVRSGAQISATTDGGAGGNITITGNVLEATAGGQILTTTSGGNDAGDITLLLQDRLLLDGTDSGVLANTTPGSSGNGGSIFIDPQTVIVRDGASIAVNSQGTGTGGNLTLQAGSLTLNNATLSAETASNTGGNISLALQDRLVLIENSQISATAGTNRSRGDGGNIDINAELIASAQNSDLTANAFAGSGGKIDLTAQGIVGFEVRNQPTEQSDITALSQQNPSLSGQVTLNTPDVDPSRELVELPETVVNPSEQIAQHPCQRGRESEFAITGRGGLPSSPSDLLSSEATGVGLVEAAPMSRSADLETNTAEESYRPPAVPQTIRPAQGWVFNDKGEVVLTAAHSTSTNSQRLPEPDRCSAF